MNGDSKTETSAAGSVEARLGRLEALSGTEAASAVEAAFCQAAALDLTDSETLDNTLLNALVRLEATDPLLARVDAERLFDLLGRLVRRLATDDGEDVASRRRAAAWDGLDVARLPAILRRVAPERVAAWATRLEELVTASRFTVGPLFRQRARRYAGNVLFEYPETDFEQRALTWRQVALRVDTLARGLLALEGPGDPRPVAVLSENRIEMALVDLACLTSGLVDVLVPANASPADVAYILRHSRAGTLVVSGRSQMGKLAEARTSLPHLRHVVSLDRDAGADRDVVSLDRLIELAGRVDPAVPRARSLAQGADDLATVMYTSGTTGTPKGIPFNHRNIVFKRFARALALPELGEHDTFLCFLPLFHTFGRFFELLGCVFWGARYCFLASTSAEGLARGLRRHRPTVLLSVPKKWIELHEMIVRQVDPASEDEGRMSEAFARVTGGRLAWGLSAAGHLDPEVFRFFQRHGTELLSGFGMTETTGGITMTRPGEYVDGSLGLPLPGIETRLADDGELLVRGPYVMPGYLDPPDGESSFDDEGWFPTGDLLERDRQGHLRLVDRKKEIYKNVKGETIAPQRVENLFRDFESVGRAFLVGDHREHNTLLIYPNPNVRQPDLARLSADELRDHFRSLVVSVNTFLAPYERIVDFAVIDRDLDPDRGELTPKGSARRKVVERNFDEVIRGMYRRTRIQVGRVELDLPNWLFQALGLTARDVRVESDRLRLPGRDAGLTVRREAEGLFRIGSCLYAETTGRIDLGSLVAAPRLWLGNDELLGFLRLEPDARRRSGRLGVGLEWHGRVEPHRPTEDERHALRNVVRGRASLDDLDLAARALHAAEPADALLAVAAIETILDGDEGPLVESARLVLARAADIPAAPVRRRAFQVLAPVEQEQRFADILERFQAADTGLLDRETIAALRTRDLAGARLEAFVAAATRASAADAGPTGEERARRLLDFLAAYAAAHPISYRRLRAVLERLRLFASSAESRLRAAAAATAAQAGFREWLGPPERVAVDPERAEEYDWEDAVAFRADIDPADRRRLLSVIRDSAFLREAVFLFSGGASVRLSDIPPRGVRVRLLGARHGKSVYRITVHTRHQGTFDLVANLNHELSAEQVREEIQWLVLCGSPGDEEPLSEAFGGYWPEQDVWSEEFISGETLDGAMRRLAGHPDGGQRLRQLWPYLAWATLGAYADFWRRSGGRLEIADPSRTNIIVPTEDYLSGVRIVSVSRRRPHRGLLAMLRTFERELIAPVEAQEESLRGLVGFDLVFSSVLEALGEERGLALFRAALADGGGAPGDPEIEEALRNYVEDVAARGFVPMRLHFAAERYRRWAELSAGATLQARARTLQELYETYGLDRLARVYPETRIRFFAETVFRGCQPELEAGLRALMRSVRQGLAVDRLTDAVDDLRARLSLGPDDEYFLARMSYPYLRPEDAAIFVRGERGGRHHSEIVLTLADIDGQAFRVRHALNPREVERLHALFLAAKLDVRFRVEHQYLVAMDERSRIIGGLFYEVEDGAQASHLEKIVVADAYRRKGVADGLMQEFFNRLRATGVGTVTTGFFLPDFFYTYGFRVEKRHAGLVKSLEADEKKA